MATAIAEQEAVVEEMKAALAQAQARKRRAAEAQKDGKEGDNARVATPPPPGAGPQTPAPKGKAPPCLKERHHTIHVFHPPAGFVFLCSVLRVAGGSYEASPSVDRKDRYDWGKIAKSKLTYVRINSLADIKKWQQTRSLGSTGVLLHRLTAAILNEKVVRTPKRVLLT
jgi:hypothetical protein